MLSIRTIPSDKLIALRFTNPETFRRAARVAAEHRIPVDAPGHNTLIIQQSDERLFRSARLDFKEKRISNPETVSSKEFARLRRFHTR